MKALLYADWGRVEVAEVSTPEPQEGEVLMRVEACGICGSEIECFLERLPRRQPPLILGHEFCGRIEALGNGVSGFSIGDPVVACSVIACMECPSCRRGDTSLCGNRSLFGMDLPGGCAEFVAGPASVVLPRPEGMDPVFGALAEPASNGVHVMRLLSGHPKETVFVFGAGMIGLMVLGAAQAMHGARVAVADLNENRLECAKALGAERVINPAKEDVVVAGIEFSEVDGVDYVVDAVGAKATKLQALKIARSGGAVCWLGFLDNELQLASYDVTRPQKTITGSYAATMDETKEAVRLLHEGKLRSGPWVKTYPLAEADAAFHRMCEPGGDEVKAVIMM